MAEIGASLREARTRARIEIAEMEAHTKIRAKYLRALENEEWELLPGPTYIKSFLKTYGDALDLDGRSLVAEYKARHEVPDLQPGQAVRPSGGRRGQQPSRGGWRWLALLLVLAVAAGGAYVALTGDDERTAPEPAEQATPPAADTGGDAEPAGGGEPPATGEPVTVRVTARADVFVCASAGDRTLERGRTLQQGQRTGRLRGREVLLTLGNARDADVRVGGELAELPSEEGPLTVEITDAGVQPAPPDVTACRR